MTMKRILTAGLALGLVALFVGTPQAADDKKADSAKSKEAKAAEAVDAIGAAYRLADFGRETKSPEMLIGAAKALRSISSKQGDAEVTNEKGEKIKSGEGDSLQKVAAGWLAEAAKLANKDKLITDLVKRISDEEAQGSLGGPRHYYHRPGAGEVITWNVTFRGGEPASVSVAQSTGDSLTLTVTGPNGYSYTWTGHNPSVNWVPDATKTFTIKVRNNSRAATAYTLYHN